ncbi:MAG TPA: Nif3-like dinuclear metal center hexameric protein [Candidatus Enterenecus merdae]|nr:Nif3-like dinuclear metal center hexameric protein [Candidatus Enterenecus merdae]
MAVTVGNVYDFLQEKAPFALQMDFDNAGFLVGRAGQSVHQVLVALDVTQSVIREAKERGAQLIVSHHPVIWGGTKSVTDQTLIGRKLLELIENRISVISAHTNLDAVAGGVNDALALRLGLSEIGQLHQDGVDGQGRAYGIGRTGLVPKQNLYDFAQAVKELLGARGVRLVDGGKPVRRVAVGGGACGGMLADAIAAGCDTFVTADVKYDGFLDAKALGINLIDAGHFPTEQVVCPVLRDWIIQRFPQLSVEVSKRHQEVFSYL